MGSFAGRHWYGEKNPHSLESFSASDCLDEPCTCSNPLSPKFYRGVHEEELGKILGTLDNANSITEQISQCEDLVLVGFCNDLSANNEHETLRTPPIIDEVVILELSDSESEGRQTTSKPQRTRKGKQSGKNGQWMEVGKKHKLKDLKGLFKRFSKRIAKCFGRSTIATTTTERLELDREVSTMIWLMYQSEMNNEENDIF